MIVLETGERARLEELAASRTAPTGPVQRATAVLACAEGMSNAAIGPRIGRHVDTFRAWRKRFATERMAALSERPRPRGRPRLSPADRLRVIAAATAAPPGPDSAWIHLRLAGHLRLSGLAGSAS